MSVKAKILFVGEGVTAAHVLRPLTLAKKMDSKVWDIHFACDSKYKDLVEKHGIKWYSLPSIQSEVFTKRLTSGRPAYTQKELKAYVGDERTLLKEIKPDLVVCDFRISMAISCSLSKTRLITLTNAQWSPYAENPVPLPELPANKIFGIKIMKAIFRKIQPAIFAYHCRVYNKVRKFYGLSPLKSLEDFYTSGDKTLYMDIPELFEHKKMPAYHHFMGPVHGIPDSELPKWWGSLPKDKSVIFISPGSSGSSQAIHTVIKTLSKMDVTLIVATAGRMKGFRSSKNIFVTDYLPGPLVAERADLVICNGGSGMSYLALSAGIPILSIPVLMDQYYVAEAVQRRGAGEVIRSGCSQPKNIRRAVSALLSENKYKKSAEALSRSIRDYDTQAIFTRIAQSMIEPHKALGVPQAPCGAVTMRMDRMLQGIQHEDRNTHTEISLACTEEDLKGAYRLIYRMYLRSEYTEAKSSQMRVSLWNTLPGTYTIVAKKNGIITGTLSCVMDSEAGLPMDEVAGSKLNEYRRQGRRMCEISGLAIDASLADTSTNMDMIRFLTHLCLHTLKASDWMISVNPRHVRFYQKSLGFNVFGDTVSYSKVKGAPAVPLVRDLTCIQADFYKQHYHRLGEKNMYRRFFGESKASVCRDIDRSIKRRSEVLSTDVLEELFFYQTEVLRNAENYRMFSRQWQIESESVLEIRRGA